MAKRFDGYSCRQLGHGDIAPLRAMLHVFEVAFDEAETYRTAPPSDDYLGRCLAKPHMITIVAEAAGAVVGGLVGYELDKLEQDRREIYIYDLAVAEPHRRQGIATALIAELQQIAARRDAYVIFVQADPVDAPAMALYNSLGTIENVHHFDIPVPGRRA